MRTVVVSLAVCVVSTVLVGLVIADAVYAPMPTAQAEPAATGWTTIVFKNPH
jgi:uncharacterized membrane protein YbjE (DUF340 family)